MSKGIDVTSTYTGEGSWRFPVVPLTMTLREYYAGLAMQGMLTSRSYKTADEIAKSAYNMADAMIKAREASE